MKGGGTAGWQRLKCRFFFCLLPLWSTATTLIVLEPGRSPLALIRTENFLWWLTLSRLLFRETTVYLVPDRSLTLIRIVKSWAVQRSGGGVMCTCGGLVSGGGMWW